MFGIPYFGFAVIIIYLYRFLICLFKRESLYKLFIFSMTFSLCLEVNNLSGYMFRTNGGYEIAYNEVAIGLTGVIALIMQFSNRFRIKSKLLFSLLIFNFIIILGIVFAIVFPSDARIIDATTGSWDTYLAGTSEKTNVVIQNQTYLMLIRCVLFSILMVVSNSFIAKEDYKKMISVIIFSIKLHLMFVLFEFITQSIMNSPIASDLRGVILGLSDYTYRGINIRGSNAALQGLTKEPSHLSEVLFLFYSFIIASNSFRKNIKWMALAAILWVFSGSFAAVMYITILGILYFCCQWEKTSTQKIVRFINKNKLFILGVFLSAGIAFIVFLFNNTYLQSRLEKAVTVMKTIFHTGGISRLGSSSETARIYGAFDTVRNVITNRPLFGFGLGTAEAHSGIACVLGQIGILGLFSLIRVLLQYINYNKIINKKEIKRIFVALFILPNILKGGLAMIYSTYNIPLLYLLSTHAVYKNEITKPKT